MTQYVILSAASAALLKAAVDPYLAKGWVTAGGVFLNAAGDTFYQAVTS